MERQSAGEWSEAAPLPAAQSDAGGGVVDGDLYYFGGFESGPGLPAVARAYAFDPSAEPEAAWRRLDDAPRPLWAPCGVAAGDRLFSFGGAPPESPYGTDEPPSDAILRYVPGDGWTDLTAERGLRCPYPNWAMAGVHDPESGLIYCVGGATGVTDRESATDHGVGGDSPGRFDEARVWTFDPDAEAVVDPDLTRLPRAKRWHSVALVEVDGRSSLHAIAGRFGSSGPTRSNYRYDIERDEWSRMADAPLAGNYGTTSDPVIDDRVYLTHGISLAGDLSRDSYALAAHRYDPADDSFVTDVAAPTHARTGPVDAVVDGRLHVVGGHVKRYDRDGEHQCVTHHEVFAPASNDTDG